MKKIFIALPVALLVVVAILWVVLGTKQSEQVPVLFSVYFGNSKFDPSMTDCKIVFARKRSLSGQSAGLERDALEALLLGPTEKEKDLGYFTSINPEVKILSLEVSNGKAVVDFDETLERETGGSCRVANIRSQIVTTLKQFGTVNDVVISINGRTEDILQP